jgi:uncharacterized membrane protein YkvA (DUF1232 family)
MQTTTRGLSVDFCRYLGLLDRALPKESRANDDIVAVLYASLPGVTKISPDAAKSLEAFLAACCRFRDQQFGPDSTRHCEDLKDVWLPIVVLGGDWQATTEELLSITMHPKAGKATYLTFKPVRHNEPPSFTVGIEPVIKLNEQSFDSFVAQVKKPFRLRTTYDVDEQKLEVKGKTRVESKVEPKEGERFLAGDIPRWLELLLDWSAVRDIEIAYPYQPVQIAGVRDAIVSMVVLPGYPPQWRNADMSACLRELTGKLDIGDQSCLHMMLGQRAPEFYPLLDRYVGQLLEGDRLLFGSNVGCDKTKVAKVTEYSDHFLARHISLAKNAELRAENQYAHLAQLFESTADGKGIATPKRAFTIERGRLGSTLFARIGSLEYLDWAVRQLVVIGETACKKCQSTSSTNSEVPNGSAPARWFGSADESSEEIRRQAVTTCNSLAKAAIGIVVNNLEIIRSFFEHLDDQSGKLGESLWRWLRSPADDCDEACRLLVRDLLTTDDRDTREKVLAALLYLFDRKDVIPDDYDEIGLVDDRWAIATAVQEVKSEPSNIKKWARKELDTADGRLTPELQDLIRSRLDELRQCFRAICGK